MIKCLSKEVQAKLRSGIAITSLQQCVEELVLNSIDAGATCIAVRVDMEACKIQVIDNGSGMERDDMENVGNRYFTSKCKSLEDLENLRFYGFRGEALASIFSLATLAEISSRSKLSVKTFVKVFKEGKGLDVYEADTTRPSSGTTVVVCNFFHSMPVRRKRLDAVLEYDRIRRRVEAISIMHPSVSFTLKNDCTGAMVVQLSKARDPYHRFMQIYGLGRAQKLGEVSFCHGPFEINGYIGREGHYNNSIQFLFVNSRLVLKTRIHKLLNFLLKKVRGVSRPNGSPGVLPVMGSPKQRAGPELQAMYVINIKCHYSEYDVCLEPAKTLIEFKNWDGLLFCVEEGVKTFLTTENLVTELSPEDIQDFLMESNEGESAGGAANVEAGSPCSVMPCVTREFYEGKTLASKAVYRSLSDNAKEPEQSKEPDVDDGLNANELKQNDTECTKGMEDEHGRVSSCTRSPLDSQKGEEQRDSLYHDLQVSEKVVSPLLGVCQPRHSTSPYGVKQCKNQRCELGWSKGTAGEQELVTYISKTYRDTSDEGIDNLKRLVDKGSDSSLPNVQLGSVGFIKHVIPDTYTEQEPKEPYELSRFCPLGPISAQDLFPLCPQAGNKGFTSVKEPFRHNNAVTSQQSMSRAYQDQNRLSQVAKRKLSFSEDSCQEFFSDGRLNGSCTTKSKTSNVTPRPKIVLPVQTGSLDRFRRMFGKRTETHPVSLDAGDGRTGPDVRTVQVQHTSRTEGDHLFPPVEDQPSESLRTNPVWLGDTACLLSESASHKRTSPQSKGRGASLSGKLSLLKKQCLEAESCLSELSFDGALDGDGPDEGKLSQDCTKEEEIANVLLPSPDYSILDANANYPGFETTNHTNTGNSSQPTDFGLNQFCKVPLITENISTPIIEESGVTVLVASENRQGFASNKEASTVPEDPQDHSVAARQGRIAEVVGSSDWVEHFDDSVGRLVYINRVTGLSKYKSPSEEETGVRCVSDITTMAVSVLSKNGFEYRCYPFQTELVLPFLPRPRAERIVSSGLDCKGDNHTTNTLSSLYSEWENPVFVRPPQVAVDVTSSQAGGLAVKIHNILYPYRFTKEMIHSMKVINQVDKKFLACLMNTGQQEVGESGNLLVLVDQHAAHERVRLESLVEDSYEADPEVPGQKQLCSSIVTPPLEIDITEEELRLLRSCQSFFRGLGLEMGFVETDGPRALVGRVPVCFVEREANELRRGRQTVTKAIVEEYIRELLELLRSTGRVRGTLPLTVLRVLASQACHGAIKFNDFLSNVECCSLIGSLSACKLPFQCAHGRPSIVPLADLLHLDTDQQEPSKPNLRKLRRMYKAWELYGKK